MPPQAMRLEQGDRLGPLARVELRLLTAGCRSWRRRSSRRSLIGEAAADRRRSSRSSASRKRRSASSWASRSPTARTSRQTPPTRSRVVSAGDGVRHAVGAHRARTVRASCSKAGGEGIVVHWGSSFQVRCRARGSASSTRFRGRLAPARSMNRSRSASLIRTERPDAGQPSGKTGVDQAANRAMVEGEPGGDFVRSVRRRGGFGLLEIPRMPPERTG